MNKLVELCYHGYCFICKCSRLLSVICVLLRIGVEFGLNLGMLYSLGLDEYPSRIFYKHIWTFIYYYVWDWIAGLNKYAFITRCFVGHSVYILLYMLIISNILYHFFGWSWFQVLYPIRLCRPTIEFGILGLIFEIIDIIVSGDFMLLWSIYQFETRESLQLTNIVLLLIFPR